MKVRALRERLYLGRLRGLVRRSGALRAMALLAAARSLPAYLRFSLNPREKVAVSVCGCAATFPVASAREMRQIETLGGEKELLCRLLEAARPGDVVYDVGTNIGLYTVLLAQAVGRRGVLIGFEPEPRSFARCCEHLRLNGVTNVWLFRQALGDRSGRFPVAADAEVLSGAHQIVLDPGPGAGGQGPGTLPSATVVVGDRFIAEQGLPIPNILKIDVEGMELEVLTGLAATLRRPECRLVACEFHFAALEACGRQDAPRDATEQLRASGFRVEWIDASHCCAVKRSG